MTQVLSAVPRTVSLPPEAARRLPVEASSTPALRAEARDLLREMAFVLQLTRRVKASLLGEKAL